MKYTKLNQDDLSGKIIDIHSHAGISIKAYACNEYPYAATIESIYYRQYKCGVDVNVVFPFTPELYLDIPAWVNGDYKKADTPLSSVPYSVENRMLLREVYEFCPELAGRFLPFISIDPTREVEKQIRNIESLMSQYPIYGIKINPVLCQSPITDLLTTGQAFLDLAHQNHWPLLLHTTVHPEENFSRADLAFKVIEKHPELHFCLAHCIGFDKQLLEKADQLANVWVDTAALTIQVQLARENSPLIARGNARFDADYSDHTRVMQQLIEAFPDTMIWGSDIPAYSYICRRKQAEGVFSEFRLKATYDDEVEAIRRLSKQQTQKACNINSVNFMFGLTA